MGRFKKNGFSQNPRPVSATCQIEIRSEPDPTLEDLSSTFIGSSWPHFKGKCMGRLFAGRSCLALCACPENPPAMDSGSAGTVFETTARFFA